MRVYRYVSAGHGMADKPQSAQEYHDALIATLTQDGILKDDGVAAAFRAVPRHLFLPDTPLEEAYTNKTIPIKYDSSGMVVSTCLQPAQSASLLNQLGLKAGDNVLQIGTSGGYFAALLQTMVGDSGTVTALEIDGDLVRRSEKNLHMTGFQQVKVVHVDGIQGYAPRAAYDHIVVLAGVWDIVPSWVKQLKPKGKLLVPIWLDGVQITGVFKQHSDGTLYSESNLPSDFVFIRGETRIPTIRKQVGSSSLYLVADQIGSIDVAALHLLLSDDHEICPLETRMSARDFWYGFQIYLMLNEVSPYIFAVYWVNEGRTAYGLDRSGVALFAPASAIFVSYYENSTGHCFAGSEAFLTIQNTLDEWVAMGRPEVDTLRVRLIPKADHTSKPEIQHGRIYERHDHYLHAWMEFKTP